MIAKYSAITHQRSREEKGIYQNILRIERKKNAELRKDILSKSVIKITITNGKRKLWREVS